MSKKVRENVQTRIYFDEITLRRQDGREVVVATGTRSGYPAIVLEVSTGSVYRIESYLYL